MKKTKIFLAIIASMLMLWIANAASIDWVNTIDNKTVDVALSPEVKMPKWELKWDLRIVKDILIKDSVKDPVKKNKITLFLDKELKPNTFYTIISVWLAEWTIEFSLLDDVKWEYYNSNSMNEPKIIEKVNVVNPTTLELYYNYDIKNGLYDFKVLSELVMDNISSQWDNIVNVNLLTPLEASTLYMLMISSLKDAKGKDLDFNDLVYDFSTPSKLLDKAENKDENANVTASWNVTNNVQGNENLEDVALSTENVPETGPEIWITLLLTFFFAGFLVLYRTKRY